MIRCPHPIPLDELIAYERSDLEPKHAEAIEDHYFGCAFCTAQLEEIRALGDAIADTVKAGHVSASITEAWVTYAERDGVVVRTYRLAPGQTVHCTASPEDDFVLIRLGMTVAPDETVDVTTDVAFLDDGAAERRLVHDVPVDRQQSEIAYAYSGAAVRQFPRSRWTMLATIRGPRGERQLGPYVLEHTPWEQLGS